MSNVTYADSESESFERICFAEKVYLVIVVTLECNKCQISSAGHLLCWGRIKFAGVREQSHRRAAWQAQEVSGQEEVLVFPLFINPRNGIQTTWEAKQEISLPRRQSSSRVTSAVS